MAPWCKTISFLLSYLLSSGIKDCGLHKDIFVNMCSIQMMELLVNGFVLSVSVDWLVVT